jgi:hypothetical protein
VKPSAARTAAVAVTSALVACGSPDARYREGPGESDTRHPPAATDSGTPEDTAAPAPGDDDIPDPEPTDALVCYPGADATYTACLPLVAWEAAWGEDYAYPDPLDGSAQYAAPTRFIDLDDPAADPSLPVAENFVLDELMQAWKGRFGVFQVHTVEKLQLMRDAIDGPLTVNSAYRNVTYNASVGGATWSRHQYGDAVDLASSAASLDALADLCEGLGAGYIGWYEAHIHCDWRDDPLDVGFYPTPAEATCGAPGRDGTVDGTPRREWVRPRR